MHWHKEIISFLVGMMLAFAFCKKENTMIAPASPVPPVLVNPAPVARAGKDTFFMLPKNDITLDASASSATDNKISSYQWRRIRGPATLTFKDSLSRQLVITNMRQGVYDFELTVTDSVGLQGRDTVRVVVGNARLIPVGKLSTKRIVVSVAAAAGKILFAGGYATNTLSSGRVDIYDTLSGHWTTAELSFARPISIAASGNKIYMSGGDYVYTADENNVYKANIDIYDAVANSWSVMPFPDGLFLSNLSDQSIAVNDKIIFTCSSDRVVLNKIAIWDTSSNSWSVLELPVGRTVISMATGDNKVYLAGPVANGISSARIDVYDVLRKTWSLEYLNQAVSGARGIGTSDKIFWGGGDLGNGVFSDLIEIDDINGSTSSFAHLTVPQIYPQGAVYKGRIVFLSGYICCDWPQNEFDWYDLKAGTWSTGVLEQDLNYDVGVIAYGSKLYVAGGVHLNKGSLSSNDYTDRVWILDF